MALFTRADHLAQQDGPFEPQRTHNWAFEVPISSQAAQDTIKLSLVQGFLPIAYNDEVPISYGNEEVFVAGKAHVEAGQIICRDWVDQPTAALLLGWRRQVYNPDTGAINLARYYKKNAYIVLYAPNYADNMAVNENFVGPMFNPLAAEYYERVWELQGVWPIRVNAAAGGLDMTNSGMVMIECLMRFDKARANFLFNTEVDPWV